MTGDNQIITTVLAVLGSLTAMLVFVIKLIVPWMKGKIDQKNGQITDLVETVKALGKTMCELVQDSNNQQEAFVRKVSEICERKDGQIEKLINEIKDALGRAT